MLSAEYSGKLFKPIFACRQTVWTLIRLLLEEQSDLGPHCLQKWPLKSQADDKADDNCVDWQFKGSDRYSKELKSLNIYSQYINTLQAGQKFKQTTFWNIFLIFPRK